MTTVAGPALPFQAQVPRDVVEASGADAAGFLQGQLSQDVAGLSVGESRYSLLLQPQGKVDAWLRVTRIGVESFLLDVDGGWGETMVRRLERFKLRTRCELRLLPGWTCWAVRGRSAESIDAASDAAAVIVDAGWPGIEGFDRLGPELGPTDGVAVADAGTYLTARIAAGVPALGAELDESTIPAEAGRWLIDHSVSFTKGCYTGQELVARVDSRGSNTPRKLRLVRAATGALHAGTALQVAGEPVGLVTSAAVAGGLGLAYVARAVEVPAVVASEDGAAVQVDPLPGG